MEFTGEITREDGSTKDVYIESDLWGVIGADVNRIILQMNEGDSLTLNRTK